MWSYIQNPQIRVLYVHLYNHHLHAPLGKRPPIMKELIEHVTVAAHWHDFGIFLIDNKKVHKVHDIQNDPAFPTAQDKLKRVFQIFLADNPTWEAVVTALEGIVQNRLAKGIRKRFC